MKIQMQTKDKQGRLYATAKALKAGDRVQLDGDFTCIKPWAEREVKQVAGALYVDCACGKHFLDGQDDGNGVFIGVYPLAQPASSKIVDRIGEVAAVITLFFAFGSVYCIACPPDPARHVSAHSMPIQVFAKTQLRAGRL